VYKPMAGDVRPNTLYEVTGMSRALNLQVTKYNSAKRQIAVRSATRKARSLLVLSGRETALCIRSGASRSISNRETSSILILKHRPSKVRKS
jgi:hypothetical protein